MQELPPALYRNLSSIFVDTHHAIHETGDLAIPLKNGWIDNQQIHTLGKLINGQVALSGNTTLFKSVGMALFDLMVGQMIYEQAIEKGLGIVVDF